MGETLPTQLYFSLRTRHDLLQALKSLSMAECLYAVDKQLLFTYL
jgi:hypothetical protein